VFAAKDLNGNKEIGLSHFDPNNTSQNLYHLRNIITLDPQKIILFTRANAKSATATYPIY
jgi:hypothetical protein